MTLRKKTLFYVTMFLMVWLAAEAMAIVGHLVINHAFFPKRKIRDDIRSHIASYKPAQPVAGSGIVWGDVTEVVHPYLGFVLDPYRNSFDVSNFGFAFDKGNGSLTRKQPDTIVVGIFGGSFANGTVSSASSLLPSCPAFSGRQVIVKNFSSGGYKQPQQLLALSYMLALGAEFDIVINIDGFNEVALPYIENVPNKVYPFYPRMWHLRASTVLDPVFARELGRIQYLEDKRQAWAQPFDHYGLYRSPLLALLWQLRDRGLSAEISQLNQKLRDGGAPVSNYATHGPEYSYPDDEALFTDLARVWKQSSLQMKALSDENGFLYFHFLQPNQYVKDSKPMSPEEIRVATQGPQYKEGVEKGYPHLISAGRELARAGVNFSDLTMTYSNHSEELYVDSCCHVNPRGYEIIVRQICDSITSRRPGPASR